VKDCLKRVFKAFVLSVAVCMAICWLTEKAGDLLGYALRDQTSVDYVRKIAGWNMPFVYFTAYVVLAAPLWEEAFFRFFLWKYPGPAKPGAAAAASSIAFAAAHYLFAAKPDNAFIALFVFGMIQCRLYEKTGRLWCVVANHSLFNIANMAALLLFPR